MGASLLAVCLASLGVKVKPIAGDGRCLLRALITGQPNFDYPPGITRGDVQLQNTAKIRKFLTEEREKILTNFEDLLDGTGRYTGRGPLGPLVISSLVGMMDIQVYNILGTVNELASLKGWVQMFRDANDEHLKDTAVWGDAVLLYLAGEYYVYSIKVTNCDTSNDSALSSIAFLHAEPLGSKGVIHLINYTEQDPITKKNIGKHFALLVDVDDGNYNSDSDGAGDGDGGGVGDGEDDDGHDGDDDGDGGKLKLGKMMGAGLATTSSSFAALSHFSGYGRAQPAPIEAVGEACRDERQLFEEMSSNYSLEASGTSKKSVHAFTMAWNERVYSESYKQNMGDEAALKLRLKTKSHLKTFWEERTKSLRESRDGAALFLQSADAKNMYSTLKGGRVPLPPALDPAALASLAALNTVTFQKEHLKQFFPLGMIPQLPMIIPPSLRTAATPLQRDASQPGGTRHQHPPLKPSSAKPVPNYNKQCSRCGFLYKTRTHKKSQKGPQCVQVMCCCGQPIANHPDQKFGPSCESQVGDL